MGLFAFELKGMGLFAFEPKGMGHFVFKPKGMGLFAFMPKGVGLLDPCMPRRLLWARQHETFGPLNAQEALLS